MLCSSEERSQFTLTASTVGYGDFSPTTETGRLLAVFFIPVAVGIMGIFLGSVADAIVERHRQEYTRTLHNKPLTMEDIHILDGDGNGEVSRAEFLEFMLVAMNEVDKELLDQLKKHFQRLDVDGSGSITKADLAEMARRRMVQDHVVEKWQVAEYKQPPLQQAHQSHAPGTPTGMTLRGPNGIPKPTLERGRTQQTSNRSAFTVQSSSSTQSYQHRTNIV